MAVNKPNLRYLHVYAVVRFDSYRRTPESQATVVKVFRSQALAERDASRLHKLKANKTSTYSVQITRFVETETDMPFPDTGQHSNGSTRPSP
jgi:hypothetical protein